MDEIGMIRSRLPENRLVIYLKAPRRGAVKKRLAAGIGDGPALSFYQGMIGAALRLTRDPRWRTTLAITPDRRRSWLRRFGLRRFGKKNSDVMPQGSADLGHRMARTIQKLAPSRVLIIGTDIPGLNAGIIARAFKLLRSHDAVFGPAVDGGFWLVGLAKPQQARRIFDMVRWSTEFALQDVRKNFPPKARIALVDKLDDVDDEAAYRRFLAACR